MKHTIKIVLAITIIFIATPRSYAQEAIFTDIIEGDYFFVPLQNLKANHLIDGYDDGTFRPDEKINRAEALKMLMKAFPEEKEEKKGEEMSFPDVPKEAWFYPYVKDAWAQGIVQGYPDKNFHPEKTLNRAEALKIALNQEGASLPEIVEVNSYSDVKIEDWFAQYAEIAKERTLYLENRSDGGLSPGMEVTRGEFAQLIYRMQQSSKGLRFARATWYADLLANQETASGGTYNPNHFTVAHKTLPFGTKLLVQNTQNGKTVEVTVNDRGPYVTGVDLDLSKSAFEALAPSGAGIITVQFTATVPNASPDPSSVTYGF